MHFLLFLILITASNSVWALVGSAVVFPEEIADGQCVLQHVFRYRESSVEMKQITGRCLGSLVEYQDRSVFLTAEHCNRDHLRESFLRRFSEKELDHHEVRGFCGKDFSRIEVGEFFKGPFPDSVDISFAEIQEIEESRVLRPYKLDDGRRDWRDAECFVMGRESLAESMSWVQAPLNRALRKNMSEPLYRALVFRPDESGFALEPGDSGGSVVCDGHVVAVHAGTAGSAHQFEFTYSYLVAPFLAVESTDNAGL